MDVVSSIIETGVDKLVNLVKQRGRILLADAAKELGVSTTVVQEWVDFLEEEGLISVEYKLTKPYLVERKLTKKEVETKEKEFSSKKDVFVRKAEVTLSYLEKQADELKKVKGEFDKLKNELGLDLDTVKNELSDLEQYQQMKEELRMQVEEQRNEAALKIQELTKQVVNEQKRYLELVGEIKKEKEELGKEGAEARSIEENERILNKRLQELKDIIASMEKKIIGENTAVKNTELHIARLNELMEGISERVEEERKVIEPLVQKSKEQERKIMELQERILKKIADNEKSVSGAKDITKKFKVFFEKKLFAMNLIYKVNKDRDELEKGLMELIRKAKSFQLTMKKGDVGKEMLELEKKFGEVDKKKGLFEDELKKLVSIFTK